jgi:hypothetical protein
MKVEAESVTERQVLFDTIDIGFMNQGRPAQAAPAFGAFGLAEMPPAGLAAQDFAAGRDLETFGHGFLRFDAFGTSHKNQSVSLQKSAHYRGGARRRKGEFWKEKPLSPRQAAPMLLPDCASSSTG